MVGSENCEIPGKLFEYKVNTREEDEDQVPKETCTARRGRHGHGESRCGAEIQSEQLGAIKVAFEFSVYDENLFLLLFPLCKRKVANLRAFVLLHRFTLTHPHRL